MNEDQTLLHDAAERYLRDSYDFNARRERLANGTYADPVHWQAFAEMGWLALPVPEILDGLGMGTRECAILAELCGQYLVTCLLYTSPSPRDLSTSRMPSSA